MAIFFSGGGKRENLEGNGLDQEKRGRGGNLPGHGGGGIEPGPHAREMEASMAH